MQTTTSPMTRRAVLGLGAAAAAHAVLPAFAQGGDKPVRLILPISAGSGVDAIARSASAALGKAFAGTRGANSDGDVQKDLDVYADRWCWPSTRSCRRRT